ncbi:MAG: hypothetical protein IPP17_30460 [Bacteroidetes bacterium]|nr:hypothetical protein [Bacteroidota bacterium]
MGESINLYVTCFGRVTVLNANGNRLKDLFNVGTNHTIYQDHGLGIVSMVADTVKVIRTDSTMAVRWAQNSGRRLGFGDFLIP